jgi:hypothetical protein
MFAGIIHLTSGVGLNAFLHTLEPLDRGYKGRIIGVGELALGRDLVDEAEFVAGLDQAAEGVLRALKATNIWQKSFGSSPG